MLESQVLRARSPELVGVRARLPTRIVAATLSALLGAVIVFGVGFAAPQQLHNAAHDTRHSINMPCH